jgi:hypothetical protein
MNGGTVSFVSKGVSPEYLLAVIAAVAAGVEKV